jgi:hypothetical protein
MNHLYNRNFSSAATDWGNNNEDIAFQKYKQYIMENDKKCVVTKSGLYID